MCVCVCWKICEFCHILCLHFEETQNCGSLIKHFLTLINFKKKRENKKAWDVFFVRMLRGISRVAAAFTKNSYLKELIKCKPPKGAMLFLVRFPLLFLTTDSLQTIVRFNTPEYLIFYNFECWLTIKLFSSSACMSFCNNGYINWVVLIVKNDIWLFSKVSNSMAQKGNILPREHHSTL